MEKDSKILDEYPLCEQNFEKDIQDMYDNKDEEPKMGTLEYFEQYNCWDAIGGDWEG